MTEYYRRVVETIGESISSINETIYGSLIGECVSALERGGKVIASGLGKNVPICEKFVGTMNSLGMDARFLHTNTAIHGDLGIVHGRDVILLLSKSGNTEESVALAGYLMERGASTWLLTFNENSRLTKLLDKKLIMRLQDEGDDWNIVPNNSTSIYLILLQGIALELGKAMQITLEDFKNNHPGGGIGEKLRSEKRQIIRMERDILWN